MGSYHSRQIADLVLLLSELSFFPTMKLQDFFFFAGTLTTVLCLLTMTT